jgi:hypothetical protein
VDENHFELHPVDVPQFNVPSCPLVSDEQEGAVKHRRRGDMLFVRQRAKSDRQSTVPLSVFGTIVALLVVIVGQLPAAGGFAALSLDELITTAHSVIVGTVSTIQESVGRQGAWSLFPSRVTKIEVFESFKYAPPRGAVYELKEFAPEASPLEKGELVLLYLSRPSEAEFVTAIGELSGDFRRAPGDTSSDHLVGTPMRNLIGNRNLWDNSKPLWNQTTFKRHVAAEYLSDYFLRSHDRLGPDEVSKLKEEILRIGDMPFHEGPIPLELLLAATHARLH